MFLLVSVPYPHCICDSNAEEVQLYLGAGRIVSTETQELSLQKLRNTFRPGLHNTANRYSRAEGKKDTAANMNIVGRALYITNARFIYLFTLQYPVYIFSLFSSAACGPDTTVFRAGMRGGEGSGGGGELHNACSSPGIIRLKQ
jgi:hypothetical protein